MRQLALCVDVRLELQLDGGARDALRAVVERLATRYDLAEARAVVEAIVAP